MASETTIVTEQANELTTNLDLVGARGIVRLLRQTDTQVFAGWGALSGLNDTRTLSTLHALAQAMKPLFLFDAQKPKRVKVIMSGAGTSGRLSFFCARTLNKVAATLGCQVEFDYLMAGNDLALIKSQEAAEDDVVRSVEDLKQKAAGYEHVVFIGITCGLSAPYVGSQLDYILNTPSEDARFITVLMGFNAWQAARKNVVEKWNKSMYSVIEQLATAEATEAANSSGSGSAKRHHFILDPVVGPEPLTGSSRMKGGTTTKLLLEALFVYMLQVYYPAKVLPEQDRTHRKGVNEQLFDFAGLFAEYERTNRYTYLSEEALAQVIDTAGRALSADSHVYYFAEDSLGILGLIDASECPPTFGAKFDDMRGFVFGGWHTMQNVEGDMTTKVADPHYRLGVDHFLEDLAPTLTERDVVVLVYAEGQPTANLLQLIQRLELIRKDLCFVLLSWSRTSASDHSHAHAHAHAHAHGSSGIATLHAALQAASPSTPVQCCHFHIPYFQLLGDFPVLLEMSVKWVLNAISLGAHVLKGKVYKNRMIDLCISNSKLYYRGCQMVADICGISLEQGTQCLLRAIYETDRLDETVLSAPVSAHHGVGFLRKKVVPLAVLLGTGKFSTVAEAQAALDKEPVIRSLIQRVLSPHSV